MTWSPVLILMLLSMDHCKAKSVVLTRLHLYVTIHMLIHYMYMYRMYVWLLLLLLSYDCHAVLKLFWWRQDSSCWMCTVIWLLCGLLCLCKNIALYMYVSVFQPHDFLSLQWCVSLNGCLFPLHFTDLFLCSCDCVVHYHSSSYPRTMQLVHFYMYMFCFHIHGSLYWYNQTY